MLRGPRRWQLAGAWEGRGKVAPPGFPVRSVCSANASSAAAPAGRAERCLHGGHTFPRCHPNSVARPRSSCGAGTHPALQGAPGMWPGPIPKPPSSQRDAPRRCHVLVDGGSPQIPWDVPKGGCWKCRDLPAGSRAGAAAPRGSEQSARVLTPRASAAGRRRGGAGRKRSVTPGSPGSCP